MSISTPSNYAPWLESLKTQIRTARVKASLAVNRELVLLYWRLGCEILVRKSVEAWGAKMNAQQLVA